MKQVSSSTLDDLEVKLADEQSRQLVLVTTGKNVSREFIADDTQFKLCSGKYKFERDQQKLSKVQQNPLLNVISIKSVEVRADSKVVAPRLYFKPQNTTDQITIKQKEQTYLILDEGVKGWANVRISFIGQNTQNITINIVKICTEETHTFFDFAYIILMIIAVTTLVIASKQKFYLLNPKVPFNYRVSFLQAFIIVIISSATLILIFFFYQKFQIIFSFGFVLISIFTGTIIVNSMVYHFASKLNYQQRFAKEYNILCIYLSLANMISIVLGVTIAVIWFILKSWLLNNVLAIFFITTLLKLIRIPTLRIHIILLISLLAIQTFWYFASSVFGQNILLYVTNRVDLPLKLLFPKLGKYWIGKQCATYGFTDIILIGFLLSLGYRYDRYVKSYVFYAVIIVGYIFGLILHIIFQIQQTAPLPYIIFTIPSSLAFTFFVAYRRNQLNQLWHGVELETDYEDTIAKFLVKTDVQHELNYDKQKLFASLLKDGNFGS